MKTLLITLLIFSSYLCYSNVFASKRNSETTKAENLNINFLNDNLNLLITEESVVIEDWMLDDDYWKSNSSISFQTELEKELVIEDWMINSGAWGYKNNIENKFKVVKSGRGTVYTYSLTKDKEDELSIENWMFNDDAWSL